MLGKEEKKKKKKEWLFLPEKGLCSGSCIVKVRGRPWRLCVAPTEAPSLRFFRKVDDPRPRYDRLKKSDRASHRWIPEPISCSAQSGHSSRCVAVWRTQCSCI
jgi:hypothetical protein